jgi:hypothetical protein
MFKRYGCTIAVVLLGAGAGAGCGGDDEEPLSKAEYIKQGDAICKKAQAEGKKDRRRSEALLEELRDLPAPEGDEDTLNGIYDGIEEGLEKIEDNPTILLSEDNPFEKASQEAEDYGFEECSN